MSTVGKTSGLTPSNGTTVAEGRSVPSEVEVRVVPEEEGFWGKDKDKLTTVCHAHRRGQATRQQHIGHDALGLHTHADDWLQWPRHTPGMRDLGLVRIEELRAVHEGLPGHLLPLREPRLVC